MNFITGKHLSQPIRVEASQDSPEQGLPLHNVRGEVANETDESLSTFPPGIP